MSMTVKEILNVAKSSLNEHGIDEAEVNAKSLMCHLLSIDQAKLFMNWDKELTEHQCELYFELLDRRNSHIPLQYIVGFQNFMGEEFAVREGVLIPRPETEIMVSLAIKKLSEMKKPKVLDLCTGSGIIAVTIAKNITKAKVIASDISEYAIALATENAKRLNASVTVKKGDLFEPFKGKFTKTKFDMIISNPPYIKTSEIANLQEEVRDYEPILALDGGQDGLEFYKRIAGEASEHLVKGGILLMEIGYDQKMKIIRLLEESGKYENIDVIKDYAGHDRILYCEAS